MLDLYKNIKKYRKAMKMSQDELAKRTGYTDRSSIAKIEKGQVDIPQSKIMLFAKVFGITAGDLMGNDGIADPYQYDNVEHIITKKLPVFDGIAAGQPRFMPEEAEFYMNASVDIDADFVLKVHGDSMTGARINDGDYVFIHQQPIVENGEIAAVAIDDEATLKRFYRYGNTVSLRAENPSYKEMVFTDQELDSINILGKAVAFQSKIE